MTYAHAAQALVDVGTSAEVLFDYLDDQASLGCDWCLPDGVQVNGSGQASRLRVYIDYDYPGTFAGKLLGPLLGPIYARWCVDRMARDAARRFRRPAEAV